MKKIRLGASYYGKLALLIGVMVAAPLLVLPFYPQERSFAPAFLIPSAVCICAGLILCLRPGAAQTAEISGEWQSPMQRGSLPVLFAWCLGFASGAAPFILSKQLSPLHALFESVSGWTTTGLAVSDVAALPKIFLFHRSFMQFCGGLGFIMMMLVLVQGRQAVSLYTAEGHADRLRPSIKQTARTVLLLYSGCLAAGIFLYCICGMELFDAVCHTMSALSTAGFTTQPGSIGHYGSIPIEIITIILMLIGSTNFAVLLLFARGKLRQALRVSELRFLAALLLILTPLTAISLSQSTGLGFGASLHNALFGLVTAYSTTGYSVMDYAAWPPFALGILMLLMVIGGGAGSTAGGIKLSRTYLLLRIAREDITKRLSPARRVSFPVYHTAQGKTEIDSRLIESTAGFVVCYMAILVAGTLLITLTEGCSLFDAAFEFTSAFGTVGISNGITSPGASAGTLIVEMVGMVLGRLEIFIVFIGIDSAAKGIFGR